MSFYPNAELVAVAWLRAHAGVDVASVATTVPDSSSWVGNQFVQATVLSGSPIRDLPVYKPVVSVDAWAFRPGSKKPPWNQASQILETARTATYTHLTGSTAILAMPTGYMNARLLSVFPLSEPRRVPGDQSGYAHYSMDLQFDWTPVGLVIA
jgi:hypothetical protein